MYCYSLISSGLIASGTSVLLQFGLQQCACIATVLSPTMCVYCRYKDRHKERFCCVCNSLLSPFCSSCVATDSVSVDKPKSPLLNTPSLNCKEETTSIASLLCKGETTSIASLHCKGETTSIASLNCKEETTSIASLHCKGETTGIAEIRDGGDNCGGDCQDFHCETDSKQTDTSLSAERVPSDIDVDGHQLEQEVESQNSDCEGECVNWSSVHEDEILIPSQTYGNSDQTHRPSHAADGGGGTPSSEQQRHIVMCNWCEVSFTSVEGLCSHLTTHTTPHWQELNLFKQSTAKSENHGEGNRTVKHDHGRRRKLVSFFEDTSSQDNRHSSRPEDVLDTAAASSGSVLHGPEDKSAADYGCLLCSTVYRSVWSFSRHVRCKHIKKNAFKCCMCGKTFNTKMSLVTHLKGHSHLHHGNAKNSNITPTREATNDNKDKYRPYKCAVCGVCFRFLGNLANHAEKHPREDVFFCHKCQHTFRTVSGFTGHYCQFGGFVPKGSVPSPEVRGFCPKATVAFDDLSKVASSQGICGEEMPKEQAGQDQWRMLNTNTGPQGSKEGLSGDSQAGEDPSDQHVAVEDSQHKVGVPECQRACTKKKPPSFDGLKREAGSRRKTTEKTLPHKCPCCPASFKFASGLLKHSQKHTGCNPFPCPQCQQAFPSRVKLFSHQEKDHWASTPITCQYCGKGLKNITTLHQHLAIHTGELPYPCDSCPLRFKNHTALCRHRRQHRGASQYTCNQCGASFHDFNQYTRHVELHSSTKSHLCPTCGAAFHHASRLSDHMASRHGARQYVCEYCGKSFALKASHRMHLKTHLEVRPFQCVECGRAFLARNKLKLHVDRVHLGLKPCKCTQCGMAYATPSRLNEHVRAAHTNARPYKCHVCGKCFAKSGVRQVHLRTHKKAQVFGTD